MRYFEFCRVSYATETVHESFKNDKGKENGKIDSLKLIQVVHLLKVDGGGTKSWKLKTHTFIFTLDC